MNERIRQITGQVLDEIVPDTWTTLGYDEIKQIQYRTAELIVREVCGMMEQAEDDVYHCFEPSERPTEYVDWLYQWRTRFETHFGVK